MAADRLRRLVQQRMLGETPRPTTRDGDLGGGDVTAVTAAGNNDDSHDTDEQQSCDNPKPTTTAAGTTTATTTGNEESSVQGLTNLIALSGRHDRAVGQDNALARILELPMELQVIILRHLNFGDLERLRRTCHFFRKKITKPMIRDLFPSLKYELLSTCYQCLCYDPIRGRLVRAEETSERYPFSNKCFECIVKGPGFVVGSKITMGDFTSLWICRWCGYPISDDGAWNQPEFHYYCYRRFHKILFYFFLVGCAQWAFVVVGSALCWCYFGKNTMVLAPTIINFFMSLWVFCLTLVRNEELRTYHFTLFLEVAIMALWIPPMYAIVKHVTSSTRGASNSDIATLTFVGLNLWFRFFNAMGNLILLAEFKLWRRHRPNLTHLHRVLYKIMAVLVFWTYPQSVEQVYPGKWWFTRSRQNWNV